MKSWGIQNLKKYIVFTQNFFQKQDRYFIWYSMKEIVICSKPRRKKMIFQSPYWYSLKWFPRKFQLSWVFVLCPQCGIYILSKCMLQVTSRAKKREGRLVTPVSLKLFFFFFDVFPLLYYCSFFCCKLLLSHNFSLLIAVTFRTCHGPHSGSRHPLTILLPMA